MQVKGNNMPENKTKVAFLGGSIRNSLSPEAVQDLLPRITNQTRLYEVIERLAGEQLISNSEGCMLAGAFGANEYAEVEYIPLNHFFLRDGSTRDLDELLGKLDKVDGIIISTPVYFGDRSSIIQAFFDLARKNRALFKGKSFGAMSVGAKRNGGQETTNIYALNEAMDIGFIVTGNGPATSQYGGTAWAGHKGHIREDYFGLETCIGTGRKVAQTANIAAHGRNKKKEIVKIDFWVLQDQDNIVTDSIQQLLSSVEIPGVEFDILDLKQYEFFRCMACPSCPGSGRKGSKYRCVIGKDSMEELHSRLLEPDGVFFAGYSPETEGDLESVYQRFIERMRYIRRDGFLMTNRMVAAYAVQELQSNALFHLRILTSMIRHNTVFHQPILRTRYNGSLLGGGEEEILQSFAEHVREFAGARDEVDIGSLEYIPIGYQ